MSKKKILFYGDYIGNTTGYAKIIRTLAIALKKLGYEVKTIANNYTGVETKNPETEIDVWPVFWRPGMNRQHDTQARQMIVDYILRYEPDYYIPIGDTLLMTRDGSGMVSLQNVKSKMIPYVFVDSNNLLSHSQTPLQLANKIIVATEFAKKQLEAENFQSEVIYPPVDLEIFRPVDKAQKSKLRRKHGFNDNDFILFNYGRNTERKCPWPMLLGIAKAMKEFKNIRLFLHIPDYSHSIGNVPVDARDMDLKDFVNRIVTREVNDRNEENEIVNYIDSGRIIFNRKAVFTQGPSDEEIAEYIQMSDLTITTAQGEGFGYLMVESIACGVPCIVPDNTTHTEIISDVGVLIDAPIKYWSGFGAYQMRTDEELVYKAVKDLYLDADKRQELSLKGIERAQDFSKGKFIDKWLKVLK